MQFQLVTILSTINVLMLVSVLCVHISLFMAEGGGAGGESENSRTPNYKQLRLNKSYRHSNANVGAVVEYLFLQGLHASYRASVQSQLTCKPTSMNMTYVLNKGEQNGHHCEHNLFFKFFKGHFQMEWNF